MAYIIDGTAYLHKTHVKKVGFNVCDPSPAEPAKIFDVNCSLVCKLGEPFTSGSVSFQRLRIHPTECENNRVGTRWISGMHMVSLSCPSDYDDESPDNNTWVGTNTVTYGQGEDWDNEFPTEENPRQPYDFGPDFSVLIKTEAIMTAIAPGQVSLQINTFRLMPSSNSYFACGSVTMSCFETDWSKANKGLGSRVYKSLIVPASYDAVNCGGDLRFMEAEVFLSAYDFGCSTFNDDNSEKCNLKSGSKSYSCLVCLVTPSVPLAWNPYVIQLGVNSHYCLQYRTGCGCFKWQDQKMAPLPINQSYDPLFFVDAGCPNEIPHTNEQRIQYGVSREWPSGNELHIMLKTIENGEICVAAKTIADSGVTPPPGEPATRIESPWVIGSLSPVQAVSPFIMQASFVGLIQGDPIFQIYGMEFPTAIIAECQASTFQGSVGSEVANQEKDFLNERDENLNKAKEMIKRFNQIKKSPCISLGMALEKVASCGCGGSVLHECKKHGTCRQGGNDSKVQLCWKCSDYSGE